MQPETKTRTSQGGFHAVHGHRSEVAECKQESLYFKMQMRCAIEVDLTKNVVKLKSFVDRDLLSRGS